MAKAIEVADRLGPRGRQLSELSKAAFLTAVHTSTFVLAVAAVLIGLWAPARDGPQWIGNRAGRS